MRTRLHEVKLVAISVIVTLSIVGSPAIAHGVKHALFAHKAGTAKLANNAQKVDGKDAVSSTSVNRANKLVATDGSGRFPNDIIEKALDADLLDGHDSAEFLTGKRHRASAGFPGGGTNEMVIAGVGTFSTFCGDGTSTITLDAPLGPLDRDVFVDTGSGVQRVRLQEGITTSIGPIPLANQAHQEWMFYGGGDTQIDVHHVFGSGSCLTYLHIKYDNYFS